MKVGSLVEVIKDECFSENAKSERVSKFPKKGDICVVEAIVTSNRLRGSIGIGLVEFPECYINIDTVREIQPPMDLSFIEEIQQHPHLLK